MVKVRAEAGGSEFRFIVVIKGQAAYATNLLDAANAFREGRQAGTVFGRLSSEFGRTVAPVLPQRKRDRKIA